MKAELIILGVLHRGNFHPYEIKRRLLNAMVQCYTDIDVGTLYYAIRQLAKSRLITAVSRERVPRGVGVREPSPSPFTNQPDQPSTSSMV